MVANAMTPTEEIKSKLTVEQLIADYVPLKQSGTNFKGLCPFHQEKTPSFMVSPEKQIWHCFGCGEGGDIFTFIQKYEGVEFRDAATLLAQKAGVQLKGFSAPDQGKKRVLYDINEVAREFYEKRLHDASGPSEKTLHYLDSRGLTAQSIRAWGLGLAPEPWDALLTYLIEKKFALPDIVASGLAIRKEEKAFDRFRKRLMFPIRDSQGRVIAFTARTLQYIVYDDEDHAGKYVNSPQTPLYNKSSVLYGFDMAKHAIKHAGYAIIVEGNMDVIMSHQAGIKNAIAVSGTALTQDHLQLLRRYTDNIILSFDADVAGSQAVFRGITLAWDHDMNVKVIVLKDEGSDPADTIQKSPDAWKEAIKKSIGVVDFYFEAIFARVDLARADHKKIAAQRIMSIIMKMKTKVEQAHYITQLASRLHVSEDIVRSMSSEPPVVRTDRDVVTAGPRKNTTLLAEHLISFIAQHPNFMPRTINEIEPEMIAPEMRDLYKKIIIHYTKHQSPNFRELGSDLAPTELPLWSALVFQGERLYGSLSSVEQEAELQHLITHIKHRFYSVKLHELTDAIRRAEQAGDEQTVEQLMREYSVIVHQRSG